MNRSIICIAIAVAVFAPRAALADDPTPAQLEAAKKAYVDGKSLHDKGNLPEAIEKFKESYRLSKNPLLLYNIAFTMEEAGVKDLALFYYRKFLTDAPPTADQRPSVVERVKVLEKEFNPNANAANPDPKPEVKPEVKDNHKKVAIKPAGTYSASDFQHQVVEEAPPGKPLDLSAFVPEDSGFIVTMYYRAAGEGTFTPRPMKWRYKELVARVPAAKMAGVSIQYYIEVKDTTGNVVTRSGKATTPNLVTIEASASPRFYPDVGEEANGTTATTQTDDDNPLGNKKTTKSNDTTAIVTQPVTPAGDGLMDVGSSKFTYVKWGSTATAATLVGLSVLFYVRAHNAAKALEDDSTMCGQPPCRMFDTQYDADVQSGGKRDANLYGVTLGLGVAAAAIAGYYWYKELSAKKSGELKVSGKPQPGATWVVTPALDDKSVGASAAVRF